MKLLRLLWIMMIPIALVLGLVVGNVYTKIHRSSRTERRIPVIEQRAQERLERYIDGIETGKVFPDFPIWTPDGTEATMVSELIQDEVVLVLVTTGCQNCTETIEDLWNEWNQLGSDALPLILISDAVDNANDVQKQLDEAQIGFPLWCDATRALRDRHHVITRTAYFRLQNDGRVISMRAWVDDPAKIRGLLSRKNSKKQPAGV